MLGSRTAVLLAGLLVVLAACGEPGSTGATGDPEPAEDGTEDGTVAGTDPDPAGSATDGEEGLVVEGDWYLVDAEGPGTDVLPPADRDIAMTVEAAQLAGNAGCNSFTAPYSRDGERLTVAEVVRTEMACEPPEVMEAENAFLDALARMDRVALEGDELLLSGGDVRLRFSTLQLPTTPETEGSA